MNVRGCGWTVNHAVPAGAGLGSGHLQVVPMFDDQAALKAKDIKADLGAEEVVFRVRKDKVAVLKDTDGVYLRIWWQTLRKGGNACGARPDAEVVLDVLIGIDVGKGLGIAGLKCLQQIDDLLFVTGRHCFPPRDSVLVELSKLS